MSLIDAMGLGAPAFPANSRYAGSATLGWTAPDGTIVTYLARRIVPSPDVLTTSASYQVTGHDRPDIVAARALGDPLLAWRLADANRVLHPAELMRVGRTLGIPLPQGLGALPAPPEDFA